MPRPKYDPWSDEKRALIRSERLKKGYGNGQKYARDLSAAGLNVSFQAYLRRERGETPSLADDIWIYAYTLKIDPLEALVMYSRLPDNSEASLYARNAVQRLRDTEKELEITKKRLDEAQERIRNMTSLQ